MTLFRALDPTQDHDAVLTLMQRGADYIQLEYGRAPDAANVADFFSACVPGGDLAQAIKHGLFQDDQLIGVMDMGFGYPNSQDAYIGLVLLDAGARGHRLGDTCFSYLKDIALARGATRMLIAVLERNPKGQAFWQRMGFRPEKRFEAAPDDPLGHVRLRMTQPISPEQSG